MPSIVLPFKEPRVTLASSVFFSGSTVIAAAMLGAGLPMYHSILLPSMTTLRRLATAAGTAPPNCSCRTTYHLPSSFADALASPFSAPTLSLGPRVPTLQAITMATLPMPIDLMMNLSKKNRFACRTPLPRRGFRSQRITEQRSKNKTWRPASRLGNLKCPRRTAPMHRRLLHQAGGQERDRAEEFAA